MSPLLVAEGLHKSYGEVLAVRGIDLHVDVGEVFALLGPNGAGKTTAVEILEGYRKRDGGEVQVLGTATCNRNQRNQEPRTRNREPGTRNRRVADNHPTLQIATYW